MRINVEKYRAIAESKHITDEQVIRMTGLSEKTFQWILENKFIEVSTLELIADTLGCTTNDIALPDFTTCTENVIEWGKDQKRATVTLSQRRTVTKVKRLAEKNPDECQIVVQNKDGSIVAHIPVAWVKISKPRTVSEKQRKIAGDRIRKYGFKSNVDRT